MELTPNTDKRLLIILILIWADIGMTYLTIDRFENLNAPNIHIEEMSIMAGPAIGKFGIGAGLIIGGLINTILILLIALTFNGLLEHGMLMGMFIVAVVTNFRLWLYLGAMM